MPTQDSFGVWGSLGIITPEADRWQDFPAAAFEVNPTVKLIYFCSDWSQVNSFAWIRVVYKVGGQRVSEPSRKIYPRNEPLLMQFPVNVDLLRRGVSARHFEVKKQLRWDRFVGFFPDIDWSLEVQELWG